MPRAVAKALWIVLSTSSPGRFIVASVAGERSHSVATALVSFRSIFPLAVIGSAATRR